jgi:asparagine synthase (glutamine-hydrolysing)
VDLKGAREVDRDALRRMTDALRHRGPDGEGYFIATGIGFGHRRLAVIDLEGGAQPFKILSRKGVLNFNGEIYNYRELARDLSNQGVPLSTRSDTEVLAEGIALEGPAYVNKLRGMFAFAYWDAAQQMLTLCRDRLGEKPLYYAETDDGFLLFASEIGAIAASALVPLELDNMAVADYFLYGFIPDPKSVFARVRKLPPATMLTAKRGGGLGIGPFWRPAFSPTLPLAYEEAEEQLLALLDDAVRAEMIADAPLGAFLSGGLDSSAIVAAMAETGAPIKTCSVGFEAETADEREYARLVASLFDTDHEEEVAKIEAVSLIDEIARVYGEPFADSSALPTYMVSKLARARVTVALSGDGGDEIFAGYRRYPKLDWAPRPARLKTTLQALGARRADAYAHAIAANLPDRIRKILSPDFKRALGGYRPETVVEAAMTGADDHPLTAAQRADLAVWLPGRMLTKVDRASMAHGLEVRPPLLDARLVEWACRLDPDFKLHHGEGKRILKSAMEQRLPKEIIHRRKQGFAPPVAAWLRDDAGPLKRLAQSSAWRESGYLDARAVEAMAASHRSGASDCSQELWTVIMFDAFLRCAASP